jgi:hypothetical protein
MAIKQQDKTKIVQIWGDILDEGFTSVPNILLRYRSNLGIKPHHLALIIDIMSFKWDTENPFPSYSTLAQRAGVTERSIRKTIQELEEMNLLIRTQRFDEETGAQITTIFDFRPLIQRLIEEVKKAKEGGELKVTGGRNYSSSGGRNYSSSKEYSYNKKTQINKSTLKVRNAENGKSSSLKMPFQAVKEEKERVRKYFREGIFRERLFEVYDNLHNMKPIEELVEEGAYKACKEIMINRASDLFKNNIKMNPNRIAEEVKLEFPYDKIPKDYERARNFFVATVCNVISEKISRLLEK